MKSKGQKNSASYETNEATITVSQYKTFQLAFDYFNAKLFDGGLPQLLVTLQRHGGTLGYFAPKRFIARANGEIAHELALNPDGFLGRTDEDITSTLIHEQVHLWQQVHGRPPRRGYHDKQWAGKMKSIGLYPSSTGKVGGKETGGRVSHFIIPGGPFQLAWQELARGGSNSIGKANRRSGSHGKAKQNSLAQIADKTYGARPPSRSIATDARCRWWQHRIPPK